MKWEVTETYGFSILNPREIFIFTGPTEELEKLVKYLEEHPEELEEDDD